MVSCNNCELDGTSDNKTRTNDKLQGVGQWRSTVDAG